MIAWYVPRGAREGGGSSFPELSQRSDAAGFLLPLITPFAPTPSGTDNGNIVVSLATLGPAVISIIIFHRITKIQSLQKTQRFMIHLVSISIFTFCMQNVRDSFVLAYALLSFSLLLLHLFKKPKGIASIAVWALILFSMLISVQAKYITALCLIWLILLAFFYYRSAKVFSSILLATLFAAVITLSGILIDKSLSRVIGLKPGLQQGYVFYMDHAALYCWAEDETTRDKALLGLKPFLKTVDNKDICLSFRPNAVNYLMTGGNFREEIAPPLRLFSDEDVESVTNLQGNWLGLIRIDPVDFIQVKLVFATQIMSVGDAFLFLHDERPSVNVSDISIKTISNLVFVLLGFLLIPISKMYFFSLFFVIFFSLVTIFQRINSAGDILPLRFAQLIFGHALLTAMILAIGYVADVARYTFPYTATALLILIRWCPIKLKTSSQEKRLVDQS